MTYDEYWNKDPLLTISYREAYKMKLKRDNEMAWLQGMYVYDAIARLTPILHAFAKRGSKPEPYPKEPYDLFANDEKEQEKRAVKKEKVAFEKGKAYLEMFRAKFNKAQSSGGKEDKK